MGTSCGRPAVLLLNCGKDVYAVHQPAQNAQGKGFEKARSSRSTSRRSTRSGTASSGYDSDGPAESVVTSKSDKSVQSLVAMSPARTGSTPEPMDRARSRLSHEMQKNKSSQEIPIGRAQLIVDNPGRIQDLYDMGESTGVGTYGVVRKGTRKSTGVTRAIKAIRKRTLKDIKMFRQEIDIMKRMDHPNIVKLFETFDDNAKFYLVMELCLGGELFQRIVEQGRFSESQAAVVMQQILRAVAYMHENNISHRDLKPENFMFLTKEPIEDNVLKVIDFGLSCHSELGQHMVELKGSPQYVAPQVLARRYDRKCDLWSCGAIMYTLLCGYSPFQGGGENEVLAKVREGRFSFKGQAWKGVSEDAKDLVCMLMKKDPRARFSAEQALSHCWIQFTAPKAPAVPLQDCFVENLRNYRSQTRLKKAALHVIAGQLSDAQTKDLRETFMALDEDGDGMLAARDLTEALCRSGLQIPSDLENIVNSLDSRGVGVIDYTDFLAATLGRGSYLKEDVMRTAFDVFDLDGDGRITQKELLKLFEGPNGPGSARAALETRRILQEVDGRGNGSIDFQDFQQLMQEGSERSPCAGGLAHL